MPQPLLTDLGHQIYLLDAGYIAEEIAAIYLLVHQDRVAIIETGTALSAPQVMSGLEELGLGPDNVDYIIPTHVHLDHAGGAGELMSRCPLARLVVHPYGARHLIDPSKLVAGTIAVYGEEKFKRLYGELKPVAAARVIEAPEGHEIDLAGRSLQFIDTPGHAKHHFCIYDAQSRGIFTGDTFGLSYPQLNTATGPFIFATTTPVQFDPDAMHDSLDRLMALEPRRVYLTHYGAVDVTPELVSELRMTIDAFRDLALAEKTAPEGREDRMQEKILTVLLSRLKSRGCFKDEGYCADLLKNDANLNAQGLEVWLQRNAI